MSKSLAHIAAALEDGDGPGLDDMLAGRWFLSKEDQANLKVIADWAHVPPDKAHVICANDAIEGVFLGSEEGANAKLEELARAYYDRNPWNWDDEARRSHGMYKDGYDAMRKRIYWHLHTVKVSS